MTLNHKLESLGRAGGIPGDHWVPGHDLTDRRGMRVETISSNL